MDPIDFRRLPTQAGGFSQLFLDYMYAFDAVRPFFTHDYASADAFVRAADSTLERTRDRARLVAALEDINARFGSPPPTFENITLLRRSDTVAVVTGQQVGLFGGPLYTVYKTLTAIAVAARLREILPDRNVVPVFWVEGEDHDFAEMNHAGILSADGSHAVCSYLPGGELPERNPGPVGEMIFDDSLQHTYDDLTQRLTRTEFTDTVVGMLRGCYRPGRTFNQAFAAWMNLLFQESGLVFLSPNHPEIKRLLSPLFVKEIADFPETSRLVISRSAELEERYHAQVKPKSLNLFLFHKGGRYLIEPRETDFSLRGTRHFLSRDELTRIASDQPELLSANVILRPVIQDYLLPTVAYIAGPAEIAYQAQLQPVYSHFAVPQPVIVPRASASIVEERLKRAMEKYDLPLEAFFEDPKALVARVIQQIDDIRVDDLFGDARRRMQEVMTELKFGLREIDPTLLGALESVASKIEGNLGVLKEKAHGAHQRRNDAAIRQLERAATSLLPGGGLQERELSIVYYLNKYGPEAVRWIAARLSPDVRAHQVLTL